MARQQQIGAGIAGPLGAAPHPVQRYFATHPYLSVFWTLLGMMSCLPTLALLSGGEGLLATIIVALVVVLVLSIASAVHAVTKGRDREYFFDYLVPHVGWPTWAPGYRDPLKLLEQEATRRALERSTAEVSKEISNI